MAGRTSSAASCVAFDLGATAVRVVEVEWTRAGDDGSAGRVVRHGSAALPANAWNDLVACRSEFANAIREALSAAGITARSVVASLPRRLVTVRFASLPHAPPEQMRSMVAYEAQEYILFSLDEVILDYHALPELTGFSANGEDMVTILLAAVRRSLVADLTAIFDLAGLELERLAVSALALAEHARDALEPTAIIDIEPDELDVTVVSDGRLLFTRASAVHTQHVLPEVAMRHIAEEVARSFTAYQNEFRHQPLAHIYLTGTVANVETDEIERLLSEVLDMPVLRLHARLLDSSSRAYATAAGIALQTRGNSIAPINLYPNERAVQRAQHTRKQRGLLAAALVGVFAIAAVFLAKDAMDARAKDYQETVRVNKELEAVTAQLDARMKAFTRQENLEKELLANLDRKHPSVDVIAALDSALPRSVAIWLTQFAFERNGLITLRGESRSESAATDLVLALQKSGAFVDVRLGYLGDSQDTENRGTATAVPPASAPAVTPNTSSAPAPAPGPSPNLPGIPGAVPPGVPAVTPSSPPVAAPVPTTTAPATTRAAARKPLTSFIITCRVNANAKSLLPPKSAVTASPKLKPNGKPASRPADNNMTDDEELMEDMGGEFGDI